MFWGNVLGRDVFVGTRVGGMGILVDGREEIVWDRRMMVLTHYFLLPLMPDQMDCETKEMSGGGGWVG